MRVGASLPDNDASEPVLPQVWPESGLAKARGSCHSPGAMAQQAMKERLRGVMTALVTPMSADARTLDLEAFGAHVERQVDAGINGLVACGTTGETPTLLASEMRDLIRVTKEVSKGRVPVIAGTCNNDTWDTIELCKGAVGAGARQRRRPPPGAGPGRRSDQRPATAGLRGTAF